MLSYLIFVFSFVAWSTLLNESVANSKTQPPMHHSLISVVPNAPWLFVPSAAPPLPVPRPAAPSRSSSSRQSAVFADISLTTYAIYPSNRVSVSAPVSQSELGLSQSLIPELPTATSSPVSSPSPNQMNLPSLTSIPVVANPVTFLPQASSILIHVPQPSISNVVSMIHIHLLRTVHSASYMQSVQPATSARVPDNEELLQDVTRNYHELAVLARVRWKLDGTSQHKGLPFHLAAVDAMHIALGKEWDRYEGCVDS